MDSSYDNSFSEFVHSVIKSALGILKLAHHKIRHLPGSFNIKPQKHLLQLYVSKTTAYSVFAPRYADTCT